MKYLISGILCLYSDFHVDFTSRHIPLQKKKHQSKYSIKKVVLISMTSSTYANRLF